MICPICNIEYKRDLAPFSYPHFVGENIELYTDEVLMKCLNISKKIYTFELAKTHSYDEAIAHYAKEQEMDPELYSMLAFRHFFDGKNRSADNTIIHFVFERFLGITTKCSGCVSSMRALIKKTSFDSVLGVSLLASEFAKVLLEKEIKKTQPKGKKCITR